jgi:DinB superfamily
MRPVLCTLLTIPLILTSTAQAAAQSSPPNFLDEFAGQFEASARELVALAEAMPADAYQWEPMEGVASVASVYLHVARYNYFYPEMALGVPSPVGRVEYDQWEDEVDEKSHKVWEKQPPNSGEKVLNAGPERVTGVQGFGRKGKRRRGAGQLGGVRGTMVA